MMVIKMKDVEVSQLIRHGGRKYVKTQNPLRGRPRRESSGLASHTVLSLPNVSGLNHER